MPSSPKRGERRSDCVQFCSDRRQPCVYPLRMNADKYYPCPNISLGRASSWSDTQDRRSGVTKPKRFVRIVKLVGAAPWVAVCTSCSQQFQVPLSALRSGASDATDNLRRQFDLHSCMPPDKPVTHSRRSEACGRVGRDYFAKKTRM